jgi:hypothetical protein
MSTDTSSAAPKMTYPQTCEIVQDLMLNSRFFRGFLAARGIQDMMPNVIVGHTSVPPPQYNELARVFREMAGNLEDVWFKFKESEGDMQNNNQY